MRPLNTAYVLVGLIAALMVLSCGQEVVEEEMSPAVDTAPQTQLVDGKYQVDPFWPQELPEKWLRGQVIGVAVDSREHIWVLHRPRSLSARERGAADEPPTSECCVSFPLFLPE